MTVAFGAGRDELAGAVPSCLWLGSSVMLQYLFDEDLLTRRFSFQMPKTLSMESSRPALCAAGLLFGAWAPSLTSQVPVVELPAEDIALSADFEEAFRLGDGGAPWELFTAVTSLAFDASGNLHITDAGTDYDDMRILVVDSIGGFVAAFGRPGEGPGEFQQVKSAVTFRDGTMVVADHGHRAYQVFRPGGELDRIVRFPSEHAQEITGHGMTLQGDARAYLLRAEAGGTLLGHPYRVSTASGGENPEGGFTYRLTQCDGLRVLERLGIDGNPVRVEEVARAWVSPDVEQACVAPAFAPKLLFDVLPDGGFVFSDSTGYAIKFAASDGTVVHAATRPIRARTVTEEVRSAYREWQVAEVEREFDFSDLPPELRTQMRETYDYDGRLEHARTSPVHGEIPVIDDLRTTWTGTVRVRRTPEDGYPREDQVCGSVVTGLAFNTSPAPASPIDVVTRARRYIGTFRQGDGDHARGVRSGRAGGLGRVE